MKYMAVMAVALMMAGCAGLGKPAPEFDEGAIAGGRVIAYYQSKGYTNTNITWRMVIDGARQLKGKNGTIIDALAREGK